MSILTVCVSEVLHDVLAAGGAACRCELVRAVILVLRTPYNRRCKNQGSTLI